MSLFAIGDLHLSGGQEKPMNVFGGQWEGHFERICQAWRTLVTPQDTVLIPGDISWAMQLRDAEADLRAIGELPGRKLILKGNHDYWWGTISHVRSILPEGMEAVQHSAVDVGCAVVCGTRGWMFPTPELALSPGDQKIFSRELLRLEMALNEAVRLLRHRPLVVMLHYPPLFLTQRNTAFTKLLEKYPVHTVVYGHLHGAGIRAGFNGEHHGIRYLLTSCDAIDFRPIVVPLDL